MAIAGTLGDFDLAGVLQIIQQQGSSGRLHLEQDGLVGGLHIRNGAVVQARMGGLATRDVVLRYLAAKGTDTSTWAHATARRGLQALREEALRRGVLGADESDRLVRQGILDIATRLFVLERARFRFVPGDEPESPVRIGMDELTLEAMRRADEGPSLEEEFPASLVLARAVEPERLPPLEGEALLLHPARHVLALLDGTMSVAEMEARTWLSPFRLREVLRRLRDGGWLEDPSEPSVHDTQEPSEAHAPPLLGIGILAACLAIVLFGLALLSCLPLPGPLVQDPGPWAGRLPRSREPLRLLERARSGLVPASTAVPESY